MRATARAVFRAQSGVEAGPSRASSSTHVYWSGHDSLAAAARQKMRSAVPPAASGFQHMGSLQANPLADQASDLSRAFFHARCRSPRPIRLSSCRQPGAKQTHRKQASGWQHALTCNARIRIQSFDAIHRDRCSKRQKREVRTVIKRQTKPPVSIFRRKKTPVFMHHILLHKPVFSSYGAPENRLNLLFISVSTFGTQWRCPICRFHNLTHPLVAL